MSALVKDPVHNPPSPARTRKPGRAVASVALALASSYAPMARASDSSFALSWVRLEGAESCPPKSRLAAEVESRIGRDPFASSADRALEVVASRSDGRWLVRIHVRDRDGTALGYRTLDSTAEDCSAIFSATVLALALTIDPRAEQERAQLGSVQSAAAVGGGEVALTTPGTAPTEAPLETAPAPTAATPPPATPPPSAPAATQTFTARPTDIDDAEPAPRHRRPGALRIALQAGPVVGVSLLPKTAAGIVIGGQARGDSGFGFDVGALLFNPNRTDPDKDTADIGVGLSTLYLGASYTPQWDAGVRLTFAAGALAGAQYVAVYSPTPLNDGPGSYFWAALRGGAAINVPVTPAAGIALGGELFVPLTRPSYSVQEQPEPAFETPAVGVIGYFALVFTSD